MQTKQSFGYSMTPVDQFMYQTKLFFSSSYSLVYNEEVNVIGTKGPTGEPIFDLIKDVGPKTELVAFFVPERPEEAFLLPAIQYLRTTLFKRLIDNVMEESPLDLSTSLTMSKVFPATSPPNSIDGKCQILQILL